MSASGEGREQSHMSDASGPGGWGGGSDEVVLTPEETMAFQRLPREAEPSRLLEERIVRSLREEGILQDRPGAVGGGADARGTRGVPGRVRPWTLAASMAASVVLFASGVLLGHRMGAGSTAQTLLAVREQDAAQLALRIQEAGSAYVTALAALGELRVAGDEHGEGGEGVVLLPSADIRQGREAALGALYGAAFELARMAPGDADVHRILQILEEGRARDSGGGATRNVVWF